MASRTFHMMLICLIASVFMIAGCGSNSNSPTAPPVIDTAPPEAPTELRASFSPQDMTVTLIWEPSTSATHTGYEIERNADHSAQRSLLVAIPGSETSYEDVDVVPGMKLTYYVYAVDSRNNRSSGAMKSIKIMQPDDNPMPENPKDPLNIEY